MKLRAALLAWGSLVLALLCAACSADCGWTGTGRAWIDENANGIRDPDEPPLSGVALHVSDMANGVHDAAGRCVTNWKGETILDVFLPGCPRTKMEVYHDIPDGYRRPQ